MEELSCDAIALLVVRLDSPRPAIGNLSPRPTPDTLRWHTWDKAAGAEPDGLSDDAFREPHRYAPFKRFPGSGGSYFSPQVEGAFFPSTDNAEATRWVCCPDDLYLDIDHAGKPGRRARIELLERLAGPIGCGGTLGLIHLSLCPAEEGAPDTLSWASALRTTYRKFGNPSKFTLRHGDEKVELGTRPVRELAEELFGDPSEDLERHLYTVFMASYPDGSPADPDFERAWRIALAMRFYELPEEPEELLDPALEKEQTIRFAGNTGLVLGNCAVLARDRIDGRFVRNFRSYWAEGLVLGLLQQDCIEQLQQDLAKAGSPHRPKVQDVYRDWILFCKLLWWTQLTPGQSPSQELFSRLHKVKGTHRLYAELGPDMTTYSELEHRELEDKQASALVNLQVYGSAAIVLTTLATIIGLFDASRDMRAIAVGVSVAISVATLFLVKELLRSS